MMFFFIILLCVSLERFFLVEPLLQREAGFNYYLTQVGKLTPLKWQQKSYGIVLMLLPAISIVLILQMISIHSFPKASLFLLEAVILLYCLGPADIYHITTTVPQNLFEKAHIGFFSVLFWFALLGPAGAVLFRLLERMACLSMRTAFSMGIVEPITLIAKPLAGYMSWLPIRFFIGIQSVFGKFPDTVRYWLDHLFTGWTYHEQLIANSGRIALDLPTESVLGSSEYTHAVNLFDKVLLTFLGMILAYIVLIFLGIMILAYIILT